ncbi:hypothetical protein [Bythopirellula goksoeyrii]|uniref:Uncharacterized protein n=1 Tax=Bythopirellula goksoeyrii TaxID=1400387 RepID=A0A5B9QK20_9BACT|nr:hypothetical protein [Bythopirellula goksoeyrii]QEG34443.1 hypothetical protein Pr1d_17220 [Bythopirellula goksoeyrii]
MSKSPPKNQRLLPFDGDKEVRRQERVRRICQLDPRIDSAARYFDEKAYREATAIAQKTNPLARRRKK